MGNDDTSKLRRRGFGELPEDAREVTLIGEAALDRDRSQRIVGLAQPAAGGAHPPLLQVVPRRAPFLRGRRSLQSTTRKGNR